MRRTAISVQCLTCIAALSACVAMLYPLALSAREDTEGAYDLLYLGLYQEIGLGDLKSAMETYSRITDGPDRGSEIAGEALVRKGMCLEKLGKAGEASSCFSRALADFPEKASILEKASEGMVRLYSQEMPGADREEALTFYMNKGIRKAEQGELEDAREMFREAFKIDPDNHAVQVYLASSYRRLGQYEDAILYYKFAMPSEKYRGDLSVHRELAECYGRNRQPNEAIELWRSYLGREKVASSDREMAGFELELLYEASDPLQKRDIDPKLQEYLDKGEEHARNGMYHRAVSAYRSAKDDFPESYLPPYRLAFAYNYFFKRPDMAIQFYRQALRTAPQVTAQRVRCRLALLYEETEDLDRAYTYIEQYFSRDVRPAENDLQIRSRIRAKKAKQDSIKRELEEKERDRRKKDEERRMLERIRQLQKKPKAK